MHHRQEKAFFSLWIFFPLSAHSACYVSVLSQHLHVIASVYFIITLSTFIWLHQSEPSQVPQQSRAQSQQILTCTHIHFKYALHRALELFILFSLEHFQFNEMKPLSAEHTIHSFLPLPPIHSQKASSFSNIHFKFTLIFFPSWLHHHQWQEKKARTQQPNTARKIELIMF